MLGHLTDIKLVVDRPGASVRCALLPLPGVRWSLRLRHAGNSLDLRADAGNLCGLFTNEVLPMRLGELGAAIWPRAGCVWRLAVIPSMIVERIFDGLWWPWVWGDSGLRAAPRRWHRRRSLRVGWSS